MMGGRGGQGDEERGKKTLDVWSLNKHSYDRAKMMGNGVDLFSGA